MVTRFRRIHSEFGTSVLLRILLLLVGLVLMAVFGLVAFGSASAAAVAGVGLVLGFLLRRLIAGGVEHYHYVVYYGLIVYGIVLGLGERMGLDRPAQLLVITATTVILFDLQFWSLSDPGVVRAEGES